MGSGNSMVDAADEAARNTSDNGCEHYDTEDLVQCGANGDECRGWKCADYLDNLSWWRRAWLRFTKPAVFEDCPEADAKAACRSCYAIIDRE